MGNSQDIVMQRNCNIFNQVWKESNFQLTIKKLKEIQKNILREYPFLESIHESMLVTSCKLKDNPIIFQNQKVKIYFLKIFQNISKHTTKKSLQV